MKCLGPNLSAYLAICLEGLRKITKIIIIKNNQCPGRDQKSLSPNSNQKLCSMNQLLPVSLNTVLLNSRKSGAFHPTAQHHTTKTLILKNKDCTGIGIQTRKWLQTLVGMYQVGKWAESNLFWNQKYFGFNATEIFHLLHYSCNINYFQLLPVS